MNIFSHLCRAFLFTLVNSEGVPPTKFDVTHPKYATLHHPRFVQIEQVQDICRAYWLFVGTAVAFVPEFSDCTRRCLANLF